MPATCLPIEGLGNSGEEVALSGIVDVLTLRHALETGHDPDYLRLAQRVIVYPKFLDKLDSILSTGEIGLDPTQSRWPACGAILTGSMSRPVDTRPAMLPEDSLQLGRWPELAAKATSWIGNAKRIAVAGYRQVLEDGPDKCDSESDAEYSATGRNGRRLRTEQANALRAQGMVQSVQEPAQRTPTTINSDEDEDKMTYDQLPPVRRFRKGGRPGTVGGKG
jgi:hypothetical protein